MASGYTRVPSGTHYALGMGSYRPSHCVCGKTFTVEYVFSCSCGGFPTLRHNDIRDISASMLAEVCYNECVEPELQPLTGEKMQHKTANVEEGARLDIRASCFWGSRHESAFLMFGCLTHTHSVTTDPPQQQCT